jgi:hypothetical protein
MKKSALFIGTFLAIDAGFTGKLQTLAIKANLTSLREYRGSAGARSAPTPRVRGQQPWDEMRCQGEGGSYLSGAGTQRLNVTEDTSDISAYRSACLSGRPAQASARPWQLIKHHSASPQNDFRRFILDTVLCGGLMTDSDFDHGQPGRFAKTGARLRSQGA